MKVSLNVFHDDFYFPRLIDKWTKYKLCLFLKLKEKVCSIHSRNKNCFQIKSSLLGE